MPCSFSRYSGELGSTLLWIRETAAAWCEGVKVAAVRVSRRQRGRRRGEEEEAAARRGPPAAARERWRERASMSLDDLETDIIGL
jgi:hypothetical protein